LKYGKNHGNYKGFNEYKIEDNICKIIIINRKGMIFNAIVDLEDLPMLIELDYRWHAKWDRYIKDYYAATTLNGKLLYLHNLIMNTNEQIDHIYRKPMDNRKSELRIVTSKQNRMNRKGKNKNNTSGYRNVSFDGKGYIIVQLQDENGKNKVWRGFKDVHEAGEFAKQKRIELYGEFAGGD
jgi:hypothetical protein